ncbi:hypothetical protein J6590_035730 [Homalodisca vitripennis]|nr:hypothetical protein J6590_035730 [Homalodisca vitripennis]
MARSPSQDLDQIPFPGYLRIHSREKLQSYQHLAQIRYAVVFAANSFLPVAAANCHGYRLEGHSLAAVPLLFRLPLADSVHLWDRVHKKLEEPEFGWLEERLYRALMPPINSYTVFIMTVTALVVVYMIYAIFFVPPMPSQNSL